MLQVQQYLITNRRTNKATALPHFTSNKNIKYNHLHELMLHAVFVTMHNISLKLFLRYIGHAVSFLGYGCNRHWLLRHHCKHHCSTTSQWYHSFVFCSLAICPKIITSLLVDFQAFCLCFLLFCLIQKSSHRSDCWVKIFAFLPFLYSAQTFRHF